MKQIITDSGSHIVQIPHIHDSKLLKIDLNGNQCIILLRTANGEDVYLVLRDVVGLCINSVFEQNIVFDAKLTPLRACTPEQLMTPLHSNNLAQCAKTLESLRYTHVLFEMNATIGADATALCREVVWANDLLNCN